MATNLDIVKRAMRKIGALASASEASADEAADGMVLLRGLFGELIGGGTLGALRDVLAEDDYEAGEWERIRAASGVTVTLPTEIDTATTSDYTVNDYGRLLAETPRPPFNLAPVVVIDDAGDATYSIYNAYTGAWVTINGLDLQDTFPLPQHLENGFSAMLAEYMADEYGQAAGPETKRQAANCRVALTHRKDSRRRPAEVNFF